MIKVIIAVDPGRNNGIAIFEKVEEGFRLAHLKTLDFWPAISQLSDAVEMTKGGIEVAVLIEDANLNKPTFEKSLPRYAVIQKAQSVGSVKRDCQLLIDYLAQFKECNPLLNVEQIRPLKGAKTKLQKNAFIKETGRKVSNQHVRDAYFIGRQYITQIIKSKVHVQDGKKIS